MTLVLDPDCYLSLIFGARNSSIIDNIDHLSDCLSNLLFALRKLWPVNCKTQMRPEFGYGRIIGESFRECLGGCAACGLLRKNFPRSSDLFRAGQESLIDAKTLAGELQNTDASRVWLRPDNR